MVAVSAESQQWRLKLNVQGEGTGDEVEVSIVADVKSSSLLMYHTEKRGSMSISLVVLRFEVADDLPLPEGLDYSGKLVQP